MPSNELNQVAGEILADMQHGELARIAQASPAYKARMAEIIQQHLGLESREAAYQTALQTIEHLTVALGKTQKQARQAEGKLLAATERIATLEAEWSPAVD